jgi:hypothetical protein
MDDAVVGSDVPVEPIVVPGVGTFAVVAVVTEEVEDFVVAPPDGVVLGGLSHSGCKLEIDLVIATFRDMMLLVSYIVMNVFDEHAAPIFSIDCCILKMEAEDS